MVGPLACFFRGSQGKGESRPLARNPHTCTESLRVLMYEEVPTCEEMYKVEDSPTR